MTKILVLGATSKIAHEVTKIWAARGCELILAGRDIEKLKAIGQDLLTRGAKRVEYEPVDFLEYGQHQALVERADATLNGLTHAFVAYGSLGDQVAGQSNFELAKREFENNFLSVASLLTELANLFEKRSTGSIAVISSVAGDRGRKSNYIYGSAKAALTTFLAGLRNRLAVSQVSVLTIKPGFVDTPMTSHLKKGLLFASAENVAKGIVSAIDSGKDIVYLPWFWRWIMFVICSIPERVFKRMSI